MKHLVRFSQERITKNTIRFQEQLESELDVPTIGTLYVQKAALAKIGYIPGTELLVTLEVQDED
jgi:hypothetical protein